MKSEAIFNKVQSALDALSEPAEAHSGLFPSSIDIDTLQHPDPTPPAIEGQREHDRAIHGSNLMHDHPTLRLMYQLDAEGFTSDYVDAADRYLHRFAHHCTDTPSGLFPWGEHSFWDLQKDDVGNGYDYSTSENVPSSPVHDHLRQAPVWLWDKLWNARPECVVRFVEGLNWHWREGKPGEREYCRHASINAESRPGPAARSCDFPRHSGFYILDLAYAYHKTQDESFLVPLREFLDYWWDIRDETGLLRSESRTEVEGHDKHRNLITLQTISLGTSLLEVAELLQPDQPELARTARERSRTYVDGFCRAPHDLGNQIFVAACDSDSYDVTSTYVVWGSQYGQNAPVAGNALLCLRAHEFRPDPRLIKFARAAGTAYQSNLTPPSETNVPVKDVGLALELLTELYAVTEKTTWLDAANELAEITLPLFFPEDLPYAASGRTYYESQLIPGYYLHGLARTALMTENGPNGGLKADFTQR